MNDTQLLRITPDQPRQWDVLQEPVSFEHAQSVILERARADGERFDLEDVNLHRCEIVAHDGGTHLSFRDKDQRWRRVDLRKKAFGQLCSLVKAPAKYLKTLPRDVASDCVNAGLREYEGNDVSLRMGGLGEARAVVSGRFGKLDDEPVLDLLSEAIKGTGMDLEVRAIATGVLTNLRIVVPSELKGPDGSPLQIGFDLRNCELGGASVMLAAVLYRMICTNGQVWQTAEETQRWRHVGSPERLREAFVEGIPAVISAANRLHGRAHLAHDNTLTLVEVRSALRALDLTRPQQREAIRQGLIEAEVIDAAVTEAAIKELPADTTKLTLWHAINGVTAAAKDQGSHEARLQMETQAARLAA